MLRYGEPGRRSLIDDALRDAAMGTYHKHIVFIKNPGAVELIDDQAQPYLCSAATVTVG